MGDVVKLKCCCIREDAEPEQINAGAATNAGAVSRWQWQFRFFEEAFLLLQAALKTRKTESSSKALVRDNILQQFEYVFEPAWLTLRNKMEFDGVKFDISSPKYVLNFAYKKHYLNTLEPWMTMVDDWYVLIAHAYDSIKSKEICKKIKKHYYPALHGLYAYFKDEIG